MQNACMRIDVQLDEALRFQRILDVVDYLCSLSDRLKELKDVKPFLSDEQLQILNEAVEDCLKCMLKLIQEGVKRE